MSDVASRIADAKKEVESLKKQLEKVKAKKHDTTLESAASDMPAINALTNLKAQRQLKGHFAKIYSLHWSQAENNLVSASQDGKLIVWNAFTTNKLHAIPLLSAWVMTCAYSPSGNYVASGGLDNCCSIYDLKKEQPVTKPIRTLNEHTGYLSGCRFLSDTQIITSSGDTTCMLWDIESQSSLTTFSAHTGDVMSVSVSPDNNTFVSGACDAQARFWDIRTGKCEQAFEGHQTDINSIEFFPDGKAFGTGSDDASCRLFDVRVGAELACYSKDSIIGGVTSVAFSPSGRFLFGGYDDHNCYVWDVLKCKNIGLLSGHSKRVSCVGVSREGNALATGSWDTTIKVFA